MKTLIKSMLLKGSQNCDTKFQNKIQKNNRYENFFKKNISAIFPEISIAD